ncbi:hypothetical protein [Nitrosomonas communis]|uniref:hypothetical protein n=1 Tax=Nitrosomonas communis TaxID=44574 RepID=UPI003D288E92
MVIKWEVRSIEMAESRHNGSLLLLGRVTTSTLALILALFGRSGLAEGTTARWWSEIFSVRTAPNVASGCNSEGADVLRGISHAGWYGDWYIFEPVVRQALINALVSCSHSGKRMLGYFDSGSMGEYMVLVNPDNEIIHNAWSLPYVLKNKRIKQVDGYLRAMWFGYPSFLFGRDNFNLQESWPLPKSVLSHRGEVVDSAESFWDDNCAKM